MPARRLIIVLTLLIVSGQLFLPKVSEKTESKAESAPLVVLRSSQVSSALSWLLTHEYSNGSYGQYLEGQTAPAAYALWLNNSESRGAAAAFTYLAKEMNDSNSGLWGINAEADIPGEILTSLALAAHAFLLNLPSVSAYLIQFQQPSGGFNGYYDYPLGTVTSSVDTAMALWGLSSVGALPSTNRTAAANYLLSLQNSDGSFNLTRTVSSNSIDFLGPDPTAITALVVIAMKSIGVDSNNPAVLRALNFLLQAANALYDGPGHVYDASLSVIASIEYGNFHEAGTALTYLMAQQKTDGGFADISRTHSTSNTLDTGWAAIAAQYATIDSVLIIENLTVTTPLNRAPTARFTINPTQPTDGTSVSFNATASSDTDGDSLSYAWTFGDGGSATGITTSHLFPSSGNFTVTLTVTDSGQYPGPLSGTSWQVVRVQPLSSPQKAAPVRPLEFRILAIGAAVLVAALVVGVMAFRGRTRKPEK